MLPSFLSLLLVLQSPHQLSTLQIKAEVNLVLVDVQVAEKSTGRVIEGLEKSDFLMNDNGQLRDVALCAHESTPLDLVLLVDTSGHGPGQPVRQPRDTKAPSPSRIPEAWTLLQSIVRQLRSADRLAVVSFADVTRVKVQLTDDRAAAERGIESALRDWGRSRRKPKIYDSLIEASNLFPKPHHELRRRAVFMLTYNREPPSPSKIDSAITALLEADATLEGIILQQADFTAGPTILAGVLKPGPRVIVLKQKPPEEHLLPELHSIEPVAEATGGEVLRYNSEVVAEEWLMSAMTRFRSRYLLGFYTARPAGKKQEFRQIKAELTQKAKAGHPDAVVRAPRGYYID